GGHQRLGDLRHGLAFIQWFDSGGDELARELAAGAAKGRAGKGKHQRGNPIRKARVHFLGDEAPHALAYEDNRSSTQVALECVGYGLQRIRLGRGRSAITRLVPGEAAITAASEVLDLPVPRGVAAAQAMEKHQRRHSSSFPSRTTTLPSSVTVQRRRGRSKWPRVWRPATSLAPVEYRKLPANARCSVPFTSRRSYRASASQRARGFVPQPT